MLIKKRGLISACTSQSEQKDPSLIWTPFPYLNAISTEGSDTGTADGTDNSVGGRDGPAARGGKQNPSGRTDQGADHSKLAKTKDVIIV